MSKRLIGYLGRHHWGILATFIALGGTAYASAQLPPDSVGTRQLKQGAVTLVKISPSTRATLHRPTGRAGGDLTGNYPNPTIKTGSVTGAKLAPLPPEMPAAYNVSRATAASAGWQTVPSYPGVTYYRDNEGIVHLSGVAQSFVDPGPLPPATSQDLCGSPPIPIFTLPPGDRPAAAKLFAVDSNHAEGRVDVFVNGDVACGSGAGDQYVSLDGVSFRAGG